MRTYRIWSHRDADVSHLVPSDTLRSAYNLVTSSLISYARIPLINTPPTYPRKKEFDFPHMPCGASLQHTTTSLHASPLVIYHLHERVLLKLLVMFPRQQPRSRLVTRHTHVCSPVCQFVIILCIIGHPRMRRYSHISSEKLLI